MSESAFLCGYVCSHLLNKFLMEKLIFVHWFVQVNRQKTTVNNLFFEKLCCFFIHNFWKVLAICKFFVTARCLDVRFWDLLYFICLKFNPQYCYLQKQPSRGVPRKRCSENMQQIYMRTHMPKCDFNTSLQIYWNQTLAWAFSCKFAAYVQNTFS